LPSSSLDGNCLPHRRAWILAGASSSPCTVCVTVLFACPVIKERFNLDKTDQSILLNEIITIDNALTRPWTAIKKISCLELGPVRGVSTRSDSDLDADLERFPRRMMAVTAAGEESFAAWQLRVLQQPSASHDRLFFFPPDQSISMSARASSIRGTVRSSALAVLRFITNSNFSGC
jgi:hypothetical protein